MQEHLHFFLKVAVAMFVISQISAIKTIVNTNYTGI